MKLAMKLSTLRSSQMAALLQMTFWNAFSWMEIIVFDSNFAGVCWQHIVSIVSGNGLVLNSAITPINNGLIN